MIKKFLNSKVQNVQSAPKAVSPGKSHLSKSEGTAKLTEYINQLGNEGVYNKVNGKMSLKDTANVSKHMKASMGLSNGRITPWDLAKKSPDAQSNEILLKNLNEELSFTKKYKSPQGFNRELSDLKKDGLINFNRN